MRTSTLRRYTCSNSARGTPGGLARSAAGRSRVVLTCALASVPMSLVAIPAPGCDIARPHESGHCVRSTRLWAVLASLACSAVKHRPADVVPQPLVVKYELENRLRELIALP